MCSRVRATTTRDHPKNEQHSTATMLVRTRVVVVERGRIFFGTAASPNYESSVVVCERINKSAQKCECIFAGVRVALEDA